jgi:translocation and assembly module TamA
LARPGLDIAAALADACGGIGGLAVRSVQGATLKVGPGATADAQPRGRAKRLCALTVAALAAASVAAPPALAFKLFGLSFFESDDDEVAVVPNAQPYTLDFDIGGDDEALAKAVEAASALQREKDRPPPGPAGLIARARGDYGRILSALYANGRYGGSIRIAVEGRPVETLRPDVALPATASVSVTVDPGPVFVFGDIGIEGLPGGAMTREDRRALHLKDWELTQGAVARSGAVLDAEGRLVDVWRQRGHPLALIARRDIVADHRTLTVDVTLVADPGPAAVLGDIEITGTERMDPRFVRWMTGIEPGEPYDPDALARARDRLQRLGVFSSVSVVEAEAVDPDGMLPLQFNLAERKRRVVGGGASYSTADGAALEAYWAHRNLFGHAESVRFDASVSRIAAQDLGDLSYAAGVTFRRPGVFTPDTDLTLQALGKREFVDAYEARSVAARAGLERRFTPELTGRTALNVELSSVEDAFGENEYLIVSLPSELDYDMRDNKLNPTEGLRGTLGLEPLVELQRSTIALVARGSLSGYLALDERDHMIVAARAALGTIVGGSLEDIPADRRFFLGGGGSIRGYEYRSVGPRVGGEVVGGLSFWEASVEFRLRLNERLGVVPFIDVGAAYEDSIPDFSEDVRLGAGIGLRYFTSLGPLRFDVAFPLNPEDGDPSVAFYIGLGQAF